MPPQPTARFLRENLSRLAKLSAPRLMEGSAVETQDFSEVSQLLTSTVILTAGRSPFMDSMCSRACFKFEVALFIRFINSRLELIAAPLLMGLAKDV